MGFTATALVTGGSSGLGYSTARYIALQRPDWRVLIASRSGLEAADRLNKDLKRVDGRKIVNVFYLPLDCSSKQAVRQFAQKYAQAGHPPLKALLLNAGAQFAKGIHYSKDNYELTFATNHVGQALLFFLLQPHLADDAHIILTGSALHRYKEGKKAGDKGSGPIYISAEACAHPKEYKGWDTSKAGGQRYALSKLVNALWLFALRKRIRDEKKGWKVALLEPGLIPGTGLARDFPLPLRLLWTYILPNLLFLIRLMIPNTYTADASGQVLAKLAIQDGLITSNDDTAYWKFTGPTKPGDNALNAEPQEDIWKWTIEAIAQDEAEREQFEKLQGSL